MVLTNCIKAHSENVGLARLIVEFLERVPILSVLGPSTDKILVRVPETSVSTDEAKLFTRLNSSVPNQCFWYAYQFYPSHAKNFLSCKSAFIVCIILSTLWFERLTDRINSGFCLLFDLKAKPSKAAGTSHALLTTKSDSGATSLT